MADPKQMNPTVPEAYWQPDVDLGGADNVQKTTFVRGAGTEPDRSSRGPIANVSSRGAPSALIAVLIALAAVAAIVYVVGIAG